MLDLGDDNSNLGENQGGEEEGIPGNDELTTMKAQLSASSSEAKLVNEVNKVLLSADFTYFEELSDKDNVMAEKVISKIAKLKGVEVDEIRKLLKKENPSDIEQKVKETIAKQEGERALEDFIKEAGLKDDLRDDFIANFNDYMQGKVYNPANVKKFAKASYRDLKDDKVKDFEKKKGEVEAQISSGGNSKQTEKKTEGRQVLRGTSLNDW